MAAAALVSSSAGPVPPAVQHAIARRVTAPYAYIPTYAPPRYRFILWAEHRTGVGRLWITFSAHRTPPVREIDYADATRAPVGDRRGCPRKLALSTFHIAGATVYWSATYTEQVAWRCVRRGRVLVFISAGAAVPGDDTTTTPRGRRDALGLARTVASAQPA